MLFERYPIIIKLVCLRLPMKDRTRFRNLLSKKVKREVIDEDIIYEREFEKWIIEEGLSICCNGTYCPWCSEGMIKLQQRQSPVRSLPNPKHRTPEEILNSSGVVHMWKIIRNIWKVAVQFNDTKDYYKRWFGLKGRVDLMKNGTILKYTLERRKELFLANIGEEKIKG